MNSWSLNSIIPPEMVAMKLNDYYDIRHFYLIGIRISYHVHTYGAQEETRGYSGSTGFVQSCTIQLLSLAIGSKFIKLSTLSNLQVILYLYIYVYCLVSSVIRCTPPLVVLLSHHLPTFILLSLLKNRKEIEQWFVVILRIYRPSPIVSDQEVFHFCRPFLP